jgi:excisionase family DNA binding protein
MKIVLEERIEPEQLLTSSEVGALLQVNPSSVKKWVNDGRIVAFRTPGGHRRIRAADLVAFLDLHKMPIPRSLFAASRRRILVVDDDATYLRALSRQFKRFAAQVEVELLGNGIDALVRVGSFKPHLIVLDVVMPELDGLEVCRRLKANPETAGTAVLLVTAHLDQAIVDEAERAGAIRCLRKPLDVDALIAGLGAEVAAPRR